MTGWLINLFPYIMGYGLDQIQIKNEYCWNGKSWKDAMGETGLFEDCFKYSLNQVPFVYIDLLDDPTKEIPMSFVGGLIGVIDSGSDHAMLPTFGYAVIS